MGKKDNILIISKIEDQLNIIHHTSKLGLSLQKQKEVDKKIYNAMKLLTLLIDLVSNDYDDVDYEQVKTFLEIYDNGVGKSWIQRMERDRK